MSWQAVVSLLLVLVAPAAAQDSPPPELSIELNAAEATPTGCRLTFVARNGLPSDLEALVFETVLFRGDETVSLMTLLDFQDLPKDRLRVRRFDLDGQDCSAVGRVLLNAAARCEGANLSKTACMDGLKASSRLKMEIAG